jgi:hypothetical protein
MLPVAYVGFLLGEGSCLVKLIYKMYFLLCRFTQNSSSVDKMSLGNRFSFCFTDHWLKDYAHLGYVCKRVESNFTRSQPKTCSVGAEGERTVFLMEFCYFH